MAKADTISKTKLQVLMMDSRKSALKLDMTLARLELTADIFMDLRARIPARMPIRKERLNGARTIS